MKDYENFDEFVKDFDIAQNALEMRYLKRWNGRRVGEENLSEHTHLVCAFAVQIMERWKNDLDGQIRPYLVLKACLLHDAVELLRGDILSITKRQLPDVSNAVAEEENKFFKMKDIVLNTIEGAIVSLADSLSVQLFLENEMMEGNNSDLIRTIYLQNKEVVKDRQKDLYHYMNIIVVDKEKPAKFVKGYQRDAGTDITLDHKEIFLPMSTKTVNLNVKYTPSERQMGYLCARTSAAAKGLMVAMCPIDPDYEGNILAIVHNVSNNIVVYNAGESFCQIVVQPFDDVVTLDFIKKPGRRSTSNRGGTDN